MGSSCVPGHGCRRSLGLGSVVRTRWICSGDAPSEQFFGCQLRNGSFWISLLASNHLRALVEQFPDGSSKYLCFCFLDGRVAHDNCNSSWCPTCYLSETAQPVIAADWHRRPLTSNVSTSPQKPPPQNPKPSRPQRRPVPLRMNRKIPASGLLYCTSNYTGQPDHRRFRTPHSAYRDSRYPAPEPSTGP